jgi:hypothetical protein
MYLIVSVVAVSALIEYLLLFLSISFIEPKNKAVKCPDVKRNIFKAKKPLISWAGGRKKDLKRERSRKVEKGRERSRKVEKGRERVEKGRSIEVFEVK